MSIAEKRTQVYFPFEMYKRIAKKAKKESKSVASVVREAVEKYVKEEDETIDWENDPFFKIVGIANSGIKDLSVNHDKYLYGKKAHGKRR